MYKPGNDTRMVIVLVVMRAPALGRPVVLWTITVAALSVGVLFVGMVLGFVCMARCWSEFVIAVAWVGMRMGHNAQDARPGQPSHSGWHPVVPRE